MASKEIMIIGAGRHATGNLYPALTECGANVTAVCTTSMEHSSEIIRRYGFSAEPYDDYHRMLEEQKADKVMVVLPGDMAFSVARDSLLAGKQVFCEKPCGMSEEELQSIQTAINNAGAGLQTGFMKRYAPVYGMAAQQAEILGGSRSFQGRFHVDASAFCRTDRDYFYYVGIHYLDLIRYLFGEVQSLSVLKNSDGSGSSYHVSFQMQSGVIGTLDLENRTAWTREEEGLIITCAGGYIKTENLNRLTVHQCNDITGSWKELGEQEHVWSVTENPASGTLRDLYLRGFVGEIEHFLQTELHPNEENLRTGMLCEQILAGIRD